VPAVGYGGMHLSLDDRPPERDSLSVVRAALDAGIRLVDTADVYCLDDSDIGHNERLIAEALRGWNGPRDEVLVATKGGLTRPGGRWERDGRPQHLRAACERSLRALGVERIALYQLHAPDPRIPLAESLGELNALQNEGKIRHIGVSNVSVEQLEQARAIVDVVSVQNRFNLTDRTSQDVLDVCERDGLGFFPWFPLAAGDLAAPGGLVADIAQAHDGTAFARNRPGGGATIGIEIGASRLLPDSVSRHDHGSPVPETVVWS
jgi:aryl-alcohol dehydrogenase-like predicted oxidoreductase